MTLSELINQPDLSDKLLNEPQTRGFLTAMAAAPHVIDPAEWLAFLWGGAETAPFAEAEQLETYAHLIVEIWNQYRPALIEGTWEWPEGCALDDEDIVTHETKAFCEGVLQGWQLTRDDWETLMPEDSEDNALLGGVILTLSMLFDPETAIATIEEQGISGLEQFEEIFNAMPIMLCGITQRGISLAEQQ